MPRTPLCIVDAFADRPFTGNPAAVVVLDAAVDPPEAWLRAVAAEMNLSETAFVRPLQRVSSPGEAASHFALRWFTPAAEVELCGHATLAAAHLLWETGRVSRERAIAFQTRFSGVLTCTLGAGRDSGEEGGAGAAMIAMEFPADVPVVAGAPAGVIAALNLPPGAVVAAARARYDWIVEVDSPAAVGAAAPDFPALARACAAGAGEGGEAGEVRGVGVTARGGVAGPAGADVVSRFFAPRLRIDEDPVTGSLHCALAPYWSPRLGKGTLRCVQVSRRGGELVTTWEPGSDRVRLAGRAVTVVRGEVEAPAGGGTHPFTSDQRP